ncbi:hypothetical protein ACIBTV_30665 [Micromonospora sp. NPDC049366]|uniref:hypothetical protein n=1 Tax=Micromonospora sp. NPDC049366 TaxID=3364271 RepID=UPI0037AB36AA
MLLASVVALTIGVPAAPAAAVQKQRQAVAPDDATIALRLMDIPAARVTDPRARIYLVDHVRPGATISRRVEVRNSSPERQAIKLYAGAASITENAFTVPEGRAGNELSGWVSLEKTSLTLAPGARRAVTVDIEVPARASKGERYGVIWAEVASSPKQAGNVTQVHRVGVRMYLDVGPGGDPPTDFRIDGVVAEPGAGEFPVVTAQVVNTGARALDMTGSLTLAKEQVRAGPFKVTNGLTIPPGESGQVRVEVSQALPAGEWTVHLVLASGTVERTAEGRITLPVLTRATALETDSPGWLVYSLSIAVALLALVAVTVWHLARRRSRVRAGARPA